MFTIELASVISAILDKMPKDNVVPSRENGWEWDFILPSISFT